MNIYITYDDNTLFGTEVVYNTGGAGAGAGAVAVEGAQSSLHLCPQLQHS